MIKNNKLKVIDSTEENKKKQNKNKNKLRKKITQKIWETLLHCSELQWPVVCQPTELKQSCNFRDCASVKLLIFSQIWLRNSFKKAMMLDYVNSLVLSLRILSVCL